MMYFYSAEVRWFFRQALPNDTLSWFCSQDELESEGLREHEYLLFPGCDSVGVKLREGRFEIKARLSPPQAMCLTLASIDGRSDQWVKWSFGSDALQNVLPKLHESGQWVTIVKERYLRKFSADTGEFQEVSAKRKPLPNTGCNVELTRLALPGDQPRWTTLGFEAFGPQEAVSEILEQAVHYFFQRYGSVPQLRLIGDQSLSYPAWMAKNQENAQWNF